MFPDGDSLSTAVESAKEQDLTALAEECAKALDLEQDQLATLVTYLHDAWLFGIRTGHAMLVETKLGQANPGPAVLGAQDEFQDLMERCADALDTTLGRTIAAWNYLGQAWIAGARFWEVEVAARLIEESSEGFDEVLRWLDE